jgi:hypothetical protein
VVDFSTRNAATAPRPGPEVKVIRRIPPKPNGRPLSFCRRQDNDKAPWAGPIDKARAIAYLAGVARKAIESGVVAARVEMLEAVLAKRKDNRTP